MHTSFVTGPNQYAEPKALRVSLPSIVGPPTFGSLQGILPSLQGRQHVRPESQSIALTGDRFSVMRHLSKTPLSQSRKQGQQ